MTRPEKHQLRRMIQNLPPRNLDQVVEIIRRSRKPSEKNSCDDIHVDLEDEAYTNTSFSYNPVTFIILQNLSLFFFFSFPFVGFSTG